MSVGPLHTFGKDTSVGGLLVQIRLQLIERVGRFELTPIESGTVADHDLRRVLVGHHDGGLGQLRTNSVGIVGHQRLLGHTNVVILLLLIGLPVAPQKYNTRVIKQFRKFEYAKTY